MITSMSLLAGALRAITQKASSPQSLTYAIQLERARQKYIVREELGGPESAMELGAPKDDIRVQKETGVQLGKGEGSVAEPEHGEGMAVGEVRGSGVAEDAASGAGAGSDRRI